MNCGRIFIGSMLLSAALVLSACHGGGDGGSPPSDPSPSPPPPPPPNTVTWPPEAGIAATPSVVLAGQSTSLQWGSIDADTCIALDGWNDPIDVAGTAAVGPIDSDTTFGLSCSGAGGTATASASVTLTTFPVASIVLDVVPPVIEVGQSAQANATLLDSGAQQLTGRALAWASSDNDVATISAAGRIVGHAEGATQISVLAEGQTAALDVTVTVPGTDSRQAVIDEMLEGVHLEINAEIDYNEDLLANNPRNEAQINDLLDVLRAPGLADDIRNEARHEAAAVPSMDGRRVPIVSVFPRPTSRQDAIRANGYVQLAMPIVEAFYQTPYPSDAVRIWYGFIIGNRGGGGAITSEDQTTYETRRGPVVIGYTPFEAIMQHELGHTYMGNEYLNQFVELFAYNMIHTRSTDVDSWIWTRDYVPFASDNAYTHGLIDIYQLIGLDAMSRAYRNLHQIYPPYGAPLSEEGKQLIIDEAPANLRDQVRAILDRGV
jgi:hypothetical protein